MFKPFHQANPSVARQFGGTGLGLSISRSLARLMGGQLEATSRLGRGSTFALVLPLAFADGAPPATVRSRHRGIAMVATASEGLDRHLTSRLEELDCEVRSYAELPDEALLVKIRPEILVIDAALLRRQAGGAVGLVAALAVHCEKTAVVLPMSTDALTEPMTGAVHLYKPVRLSSLRTLLEGSESGLMPLATEEQVDGGESAEHAVVLVVDDDPTSQIVVQSMLARPGTATLAAGDGEEALEALERQPVDLVLMDLQMPLLDGLAATRALRARERATGSPRVPVIAMSGNSDAEERAACLEAGMDAFLVKPVPRRPRPSSG